MKRKWLLSCGILLVAAACDGTPDSTTAPDASAPGGAPPTAALPETIDPINLAAMLDPGLRSLAAAPSGGARLVLTPAGEAILSNGTVQLGVARSGNLNVPGGTASGQTRTTIVGLRFVPTNNEATSPGCLCEGWGVADAAAPTITGYANKSRGSDGLTVVSFTSTDDFAQNATSVVTTDAGPKRLRVTHAFRPAPQTPNLYEVTVTIENVGTQGIGDLRYRRTFDWDVEPTAFSEYVTIQGTAAATNVLKATNNGFASSDPLSANTESSAGGTGDFVDLGPRDHGSNFDFGFGPLAVGATRTFTVYYGAAPNETDALNALKSVGAEVYSFGQPSGAGGRDAGTPNTFVFAFRGVGGVSLNQPPTATLAPATRTVEAGASVTFTTGATDPNNDTPLTCAINFGETGAADAALSSCTGTTTKAFAAPGTYTVRLTVRDPFGATGSATATITVTAPSGGNRAPAPTLALSPKTIDVGGSTTATTGATDPDGDTPLTCSINWGDGAVSAFDSCTTPRTHAYAAAGRFTVTFTARDPSGATGEVSDTVRVVAPETNTPPEIVNLRGFPEGAASYGLNARSCYGREQVCIKYTIRDADPGDTPFATTVNWGDGSPTYAPNPIPAQNVPLLAFHNYSAAGTYTVTVTATDRRGASSTRTISLTVSP